MLKNFGHFQRFIYYLAKFWIYFGKFDMVLDKCSVLQTAKYWTNKLAIWSHWSYLCSWGIEAKENSKRKNRSKPWSSLVKSLTRHLPHSTISLAVLYKLKRLLYKTTYLFVELERYLVSQWLLLTNGQNNLNITFSKVTWSFGRTVYLANMVNLELCHILLLLWEFLRLGNFSLL